MAATSPSPQDACYLERPAGRIAYDVRGSGPLVICMPGMGDVRSVYRFLAPTVAQAGFRVATMDLRGHGESDVGFDAYDDIAAGTDLIALAEKLGGPAVFVGNSMGAGAACWATAERPDLVTGLILLGAFVRDGDSNFASEWLFRIALLKPWGPAVWRSYFKRFYPGRRGAEFEEHLTEVVASLRRPGHWTAFERTTRTSHAPAEARLGAVHAPVLVVMGDADPDFVNAAAEAGWIAKQLDAEVLMIPGAGHYPQAEFPEVVSPAVVDFLKRVASHSKNGGSTLATAESR